MASTPPDIDVRKVAALARLELTDDEIALFTTQLASILQYATTVQEADTAGVPPTSHPFASGPEWREDRPTGSLDREEALHAAPMASVGTGLFKVPKVL